MRALTCLRFSMGLPLERVLFCSHFLSLTLVISFSLVRSFLAPCFYSTNISLIHFILVRLFVCWFFGLFMSSLRCRFKLIYRFYFKFIGFVFVVASFCVNIFEHSRNVWVTLMCAMVKRLSHSQQTNST